MVSGQSLRPPLSGGAMVLLAALVATIALLPCSSAQGPNLPPTAVISSPADGTELLVGDTITFDGSASWDDDQVNLSYEWNFSGVLVSGRDKAIVQRTFLSPGDVLVILRVIDSGGRESMAHITVHVRSENQAPMAAITEPAEGQAVLNGRTIQFDGSASYDPEGGALVYRWETNRTIDPIGDRAKFPLKLPLGRYLVTLYVFDQLGLESTATVNISVVTDVPPDLSEGRVDPTIGPAGLPGGFNFSVIYTDADNHPPTEILVSVGRTGQLVPHDMVPTDPADNNYMNGRAYHANVSLDTGSYVYVFSCRDLFYACATALSRGPDVYSVESIANPALGVVVTVNWTQRGTVTLQAVPSPGASPSDVVILSPAIRVTIASGTWSEARLELEYDESPLIDSETITLLWYDHSRGIWVPTTGQQLDTVAHAVEGTVPEEDIVMAVFGQLSSSYENNPPHLEIAYDIRDAYVGEELVFDASPSSDPDGGVLLFFWDFEDDGTLGPWIPGVRASHVYGKEGTYQVVLRAVDGQEEHLLFQNVSIRPEEDYTPGPFDNTDALFFLASVLVIAFGLAIAYRLHRPKTYDDLFGKAYRRKEADEYSQLFRKLTEEELRGEMAEEEGEEGEPAEEEGEADAVDEVAEAREGEVGEGKEAVVDGTHRTVGEDEEEEPD